MHRYFQVFKFEIREKEICEANRFQNLFTQWIAAQCVTWKGVLTRLTSVSRMCTLSCVCSRMKDRKVWRRAGSGTERRNRSR